MVTATKESKSTSKRKQAQGAAAETPGTDTAGGQPSPESRSFQELSVRLAKFGFVVSVDAIEAWDPKAPEQIGRAVDCWDDEFAKLMEGEMIPGFVRTPIPPLLRDNGFDLGGEEHIANAKQLGREAQAAGRDSGFCPFPLESVLAKSWGEGFDAAVVDATTPANSTELATKAPAKTEAERKAEFAERQQAAIDDARAKIEAALDQQRHSRSVWNKLKKQLKSVKQDYEDAVEEAQDAHEELQDALDGNLPAQRSLPFPAEKPSVADQNVGGPARPLPEDHGAAMDLNCLKKGEIQKHTACRDDVGLSAKQIEKLKEAVAGDTIAALEKFQRETFNWVDAINGFGEAAITLLQDAHLEIRKKFPMPTADDAVDEIMTESEALKRLSELIDRCGDIADECDNPDGVTFLDDVAEKAGGVRKTILDQHLVTPDQDSAIKGWEAGVEKWADDEVDEDLDVPAADDE